MDYYQVPLFLCLCFISSLSLYLLKHLLSSPKHKLPPGPKPWPIIGNIHQLSNNPHRSLARLSYLHGPLMSLKLGCFTTIVVSSVDLAKDVFQNHDVFFSSRKIPEAAHAMSHSDYSVAWLPVSPKWRTLRKICSVHLFTKKRLDETEMLRIGKVQELVECVREHCKRGEGVVIGRAAFTTLLNLLSNTFFSMDLVEQSSKASQELKDVAWGLLEVNGRPNLADFFPVLGWFDLFGIRRNGEAYSRKFLDIFDEIIQKKLTEIEALSSSSSKDDVLTTLLKISQEDGSDLDVHDIRHLLLDLFVAGTDTTSTTLEWTMTELLRNPRKMARAQAEMDDILGKQRLVHESDIVKLPYLQAIVKEAMRLHPAAPLLLPHKAERDVHFRGYIIPRDTQLLVNVWATNRDPDAWENPTEFSPERFLDSEINFNGQHFELLPFGAGRRMCPGLPLASRMLHLMLANLLYAFNWEYKSRLAKQDIDMTEKFGISLQKANPLLAIPVPKRPTLQSGK